MVIKTTRWRPDTCNCILEYTWDDELSPDQITHTLSNVVRRCEAHMNLADNMTVYNTVKEENPRKNIMNKVLLDNAPTAVYDIDVDGNRVFKNGISVSWSWSGTAPNRLLTITVVGITLTQNQKNSIQNKLNERFGIDKVVIQ